MLCMVLTYYQLKHEYMHTALLSSLLIFATWNSFTKLNTVFDTFLFGPDVAGGVCANNLP